MCSLDYVCLGLSNLWLPTGNFTWRSRRLDHKFRGLAASKYGTKPRFPPRFHWWELKGSKRIVRISVSCRSKNCIYNNCDLLWSRSPANSMRPLMSKWPNDGRRKAAQSVCSSLEAIFNFNNRKVSQPETDSFSRTAFLTLDNLEMVHNSMISKRKWMYNEHAHSIHFIWVKCRSWC